MASDTKPNMPAADTETTSLTQALAQSEHATGLVEQCADELSGVNSVLKQELIDLDPPPVIAHALEKSASAEDKAQDAAVELAAVNQVLQDEIEVRQLLEHQLCTAKAQEEAARHMAFHDVLTGLPNRVLFSERLEQALARANRHGLTLAIMFVDLDEFKNINDSHGHDVGDRVLQMISARLTENTRAEDTVCRQGGDEFLYLLMEIEDARSVAVIAEKIIHSIQQPCIIQLGDKMINTIISASIGIAVFPKDGTTHDALVQNADKAMYLAKRNRCGYAFVP